MLLRGSRNRMRMFTKEKKCLKKSGLVQSVCPGKLQLFNKYLSSMEGSFSCRWGFTPVIGRMLVDKALMV